MGRKGDSDANNNPTIPQLNTFGFTRSGAYSYNNGNLSTQSSYGLYWSRTRNGTTYAYDLRFYSTNLYPRDNRDRGDGFTLRCLAR